MAELTIDPDLIRNAAAQAIMALLGEDKDKLVTGLVADALAAKPHGGSQSEFDKALRSVIDTHTRAVIREWLEAHSDSIRAHIFSKMEERKDEVLATVCEDIFKRMGWSYLG